MKHLKPPQLTSKHTIEKVDIALNAAELARLDRLAKAEAEKDKLVGLPNIAHVIGVHETTARRYIDQGIIPAKRVGKFYIASRHKVLTAIGLA